MTEEAKQLRALVRLVAYGLADKTQLCVDDVLAYAYDKEPVEETPQIDQKEDDGFNAEVEGIYKMYPTSCPNRGTSTGKCSKDKQKIAKLIKRLGYQSVYSITANYIDSCIRGKCYLKNFSTFLNNFPDEEEPAKAQPAEDNHYR